MLAHQMFVYLLECETWHVVNVTIGQASTKCQVSGPRNDRAYKWRPPSPNSPAETSPIITLFLWGDVKVVSPLVSVPHRSWKMLLAQRVYIVSQDFFRLTMGEETNMHRDAKQLCVPQQSYGWITLGEEEAYLQSVVRIRERLLWFLWPRWHLFSSIF